MLSDDQKRAIYDRYGVRGLSRGGGGSDGGGDGHDGMRRAPSHGQYYEPEISPEDLFNMFFGTMGSMSREFWRT